MSKHILLSLSLMAVTMHSFAYGLQDESDSNLASCSGQKQTESSYYNIGVDNFGGWDSNWFVGAQGGVSAFIGIPLGCGDVFDRLTPCVNAYVGKWVKPTVGLRIAGHGFRLKNSDFETMKYGCVHADLMYNVSNLFHDYSESLPRWDFIPYIGAGISFTDQTPGGICSDACSDNINHPFTLSYGLQVRYRLTERLHATAELGGLSTFQSFDGKGSASKFGDNLFSLSAGISYVIGKVGWKSSKVTCGDIPDAFGESSASCRKVDDHGKDKYGRNDYSGLNSLRARLSGADDGAKAGGKSDSVITVGIPVYFFFKINTDELIDDCQKINLDEIAKIVKERNLSLRITGAADSATGSPELNMELSKKRARRIAKELKDRGVDLEQMRGYSCGGIDTYEPDKANRFTKVVLSHF